jgi:hypothetical protein
MGMYIDDKTVDIIQEWIDHDAQSGKVFRRFQEIGFRKGGPVPSIPPSKAQVLTRIAGPDEELLSQTQMMDLIVSRNAADPKKHYLSARARNFCMLRRDQSPLSDDQMKFFQELWTISQQEADYPTSSHSPRTVSS